MIMIAILAPAAIGLGYAIVACLRVYRERQEYDTHTSAAVDILRNGL